jgi:aconitase A
MSHRVNAPAHAEFAEDGAMIDIRQHLQLPSGASVTYYSLPQLEKSGVASISRLPVSLRLLPESVPLVLRIDTPIEAAYFSAGGILPNVLEQLLAHA